VFERCQRNASYRPASLLEWSLRKKLDLEGIINKIDNHPGVWSSIDVPGIVPR
jgi:hypothetical protein